MLSLVPSTVNGATDLLRLLSLPVLAWAAARDLRTRRVPNRTWLPLVAFGAVLLAWDAWDTAAPGLFALRVAVGVGVVAPLGFAFWWLGAFGGADAKALAAVCVLFPLPPAYLLGTTTLPLSSVSGAFSLSMLTDAVLLAGLVPLFLFVRNALAGRLSLAGFVGRPVDWRALPTTHGRLLARPNGLDAGLDLDALRMYLAWRGERLRDLRATPDRARDPASLPAEPHPPGDGAVGPITDGGRAVTHADQWGAAAFLDGLDGDAYGTTPARLREALDAVVARERLWVSPGIPFLVALFAGLCLALVYGDLLYTVVDGLGLL